MLAAALVNEPGTAYVPDAQAAHAVDASLSWSCRPAGDAVHCVDPEAEYVPAMKDVQDVALPEL